MVVYHYILHRGGVLCPHWWDGEEQEGTPFNAELFNKDADTIHDDGSLMTLIISQRPHLIIWLHCSLNFNVNFEGNTITQWHHV